MSQLLRITMLIVPGVLLVGSTSLDAAQVRGSVTPPKQSAPREVDGYTKTRVAVPAEDFAEREKVVALFLRSKESLPIPAPTTHLEIVVRGMRLIPAVATCAVDAQVVFINNDPEPVEVLVDDQKVGPIAPGASASYTCTASESEAPRQIRVPRWRHISGLIHVGVSGVAGRPNERGYFLLNAPQGTYELQYVTTDGVVMRTPVEIKRADVDVGVADLAVSPDATPETGDAPENE